MHLLLKVDREDPDHKNQILDLEAGQILVKSDQQDYRPILKIRWRRPSWRPTRSGPGPKSSEQSPKTLVHLHCPIHHVSFKGPRIDGWLTLCQTAPPCSLSFSWRLDLRCAKSWKTGKGKGMTAEEIRQKPQGERIGEQLMILSFQSPAGGDTSLMDTSMASSGRGRRSTPAEAAAEIRYEAQSMPVSLIPRSLSIPALSTTHTFAFPPSLSPSLSLLLRSIRFHASLLPNAF